MQKKAIDLLEPRDIFTWETDHYMKINPGEMFKIEEDMIYAIKLTGEDKGLLFDFPKGMKVQVTQLFSLSSEMNPSIIQEQNEIVYQRKWGNLNSTQNKQVADKYPAKEKFTCYTCPETIICKFAFDLLNTNGDCQALK